MGAVWGVMARTLGQTIREAREARGLSPKALADAISRTPSYVSRLEADGIKTPPPDVVGSVACFLGLDETELVRLIGYLSTVAQTDEERASRLAINPTDPRFQIADRLRQVADGDLPAVAVVVETLASRPVR